ncbi:MAG: hypothetical protein IJH50_01705 [Kiritimatiellae bacterium]|nr:hypothetical protein [Kiritimatiellia bacterium]
MIVPMKHLDLVCLASDREATVAKLRDIGVVHLALASAGGDAVMSAKGDVTSAETAVRLILKARGKAKRDSLDVRVREVGEVLAISADCDALRAEKDRLEREIRAYEPYGDFDPALARKLLDLGIGIGDILPARLPEMRLSKMREKLERVVNRIRIDEAKMAASDDEAIVRKFPQLADRVAFAEARELLEDRGTVSLVSGWVPATGAKAVLAGARECGWGVLLRDPAEGELPPTLIEPPRLFRPIAALFSGLGIAPAYTEADVSVPFMCYFSLFFAMLVGDGGYGAIILALTLWGWRKYRTAKSPSPLLGSWLVLLTVFSLATIAWGVISNNWFGAGLPFAEEWPTAKWLGDPTYGNMMFLCFTIGASHLVLARLWNGICLINGADCLPEFGWAGILVFMYFVVNAIVGISSGVPTWSYWLFGVSLVLVVSRTRGIALGMLPLNVMSAMGDIISYVRLFAVGYASLQVARNFNGMALELNLPMWAKVVPMVAILLIGHGINFALAGLAILVHAVRLNTLEFSNHKGLTWSGYAYSPFRKH